MTSPSSADRSSRPWLLRAAAAGLLLGLVHPVPGLSGSALLLAAGVYPGAIGALAELAGLRLGLRPVVRLAAVGLPAAVAAALWAGPVEHLVDHRRWVLHSLCAGLLLGGVPRLWRRARPASAAAAIAAALAFAALLGVAFAGAPAREEDAGGYALRLAGGAAASSALLVPGLSGGQALRVLGLHEPVRDSLEALRRGAFGCGGPDLALALGALGVLAPLGIGAAAGLAGTSHFVRWALARFEKPALGALLGLLLGAAVGLWPFQRPAPPEPGDAPHGRRVTALEAESFEPRDWPLERFTPSAAEALGSAGLVGAGLVATLALGRLGREPGPGRSA